ncbi:MAG TPA: hypothetical protein ENN77_01200 [Candidatus Wirthbacteria bacterium]|nr:hypothetical protein [Candidatus Wirthbacteria bacterium]
MIHTFLKANVTGVFELSMGRVGPTEARIMVIVINLIILYAGNPILVTRPLRFNLADLMGVCTFLTLFQVYLRAVFSSLFGKNKIKEDND